MTLFIANSSKSWRESHVNFTELVLGYIKTKFSKLPKNLKKLIFQVSAFIMIYTTVQKYFQNSTNLTHFQFFQNSLNTSSISPRISQNLWINHCSGDSSNFDDYYYFLKKQTYRTLCRNWPKSRNIRLTYSETLPKSKKFIKNSWIQHSWLMNQKLLLSQSMTGFLASIPSLSSKCVPAGGGGASWCDRRFSSEHVSFGFYLTNHIFWRLRRTEKRIRGRVRRRPEENVGGYAPEVRIFVRAQAFALLWNVLCSESFDNWRSQQLRSVRSKMHRNRLRARVHLHEAACHGSLPAFYDDPV